VKNRKMMEEISNGEKRAKTEQALNGIKNLPLIPKVMFEVTKLLRDPLATTNSLAGLIAKDQGLTAKILSVANSPLYGLQRKVTSLEFAIIVLGYKEITNIVTAISLADAVRISSDKDFDQVDFWIHSMVVGTAAKGIAQNLGHLDLGSDCFVAGVLHDFGIQVLHRFLRPQFVAVVDMVNSTTGFLDAESSVLGLTHQDVGKFLAEKWNLPRLLCDILQFHHTPNDSVDNKVISSIVHLADYMTQKLQVGYFYWDNGMVLDKSILDIFQFSSEESLDEFIQEYRESFIQTANSIRL
jgi:HD-like signal output (HDOD) protein